jgi:hypothetical protein
MLVKPTRLIPKQRRIPIQNGSWLNALKRKTLADGPEAEGMSTGLKAELEGFTSGSVLMRRGGNSMAVCALLFNSSVNRTRIFYL